MALEHTKASVHYGSRLYDGYSPSEVCGVDDVDLKEEGVGGVEAIEMHALDEDDGSYEATVWRVGVAFI